MPKDRSATQLSEPQAALLALWRERRGGRAMPGRADIGPLDLRPWLGRTHLLEVIDGGADFLYRVHGTEIVRRIGVEMTGRRISDWGEPNRTHAFAIYRAALAAGKPYLEARDENFENKVAGFLRLVLPLSDAGGRISHLLVYLEDYRIRLGDKVLAWVIDD